MAQVPAIRWSQGDMIDYTPSGNVTAGDVVVQGGVVGIAVADIAANALGALAVRNVFKVPKKTGAVAAGDRVFWDAAGNPNTGTAGTGAATNSNTAGGTPMGYAVLAALSADDFVYVQLGPATGHRLPAAVVAAAGSTQADAAQVPEGFVHVTGADATKGVLLPPAVAGAQVLVKNADAANAILKIWPATGDAINAIAANSSMSIAAKTSVLLTAIDGTTWFTLPLLPS